MSTRSARPQLESRRHGWRRCSPAARRVLSHAVLPSIWGRRSSRAIDRDLGRSADGLIARPRITSTGARFDRGTRHRRAAIAVSDPTRTLIDMAPRLGADDARVDAGDCRQARPRSTPTGSAQARAGSRAGPASAACAGPRPADLDADRLPARTADAADRSPCRARRVRSPSESAQRLPSRLLLARPRAGASTTDGLRYHRPAARRSPTPSRDQAHTAAGADPAAVLARPGRPRSR